MTPNEIQALICGLVMGAQLVNGLNAFLGWRGCRAAARRGNSPPTSTRADLRTQDVSVEPHPAELLEASARGFELDLRTAVDRFGDAARREGML
jgi:hypothetical protein